MTCLYRRQRVAMDAALAPQSAVQCGGREPAAFAPQLGPPWWFHDSPQGIRRYLDQVVESAGFYNLAGFNDDTRALLSIPARHDVWRREVCGFLGRWVGENRISKSTARATAQ